MTNGGERRDSRALDAELIDDPTARAEAEARNGLREYDAGIAAAQTALDRGGSFKLRLSLILSLHREALSGISSYAGNFRPGAVEISQSQHHPQTLIWFLNWLKICVIMSTIIGTVPPRCT